MPDERPSHSSELPARVSGRATNLAPRRLTPFPEPLRPDRAAEPEWLTYLNSIRRHKWLVAGITLAGTVLGFVATRFMAPEYQTKATIWIDVASTREQNNGPIWTGTLPISTGWQDMLESRAVLDDVVRNLKLYLSWEEQ